MIPDEATRRQMLALLQTAYRRHFGTASEDEVRAELEEILGVMAGRMGPDWHDSPEASCAERLAAFMYLDLPEAELRQLAGKLDAFFAAHPSGA